MFPQTQQQQHDENLHPAIIGGSVRAMRLSLALSSACWFLLFCGFDLLPVLTHFINAFDFYVSKYMGMTTNQLYVMPWATSVS